MKKAIMKYIRQLIMVYIFTIITLLFIYFDLRLNQDIGLWISSILRIYVSSLNPFSNGFSSFYRFVIILTSLIFSFYSLYQLIKQNRILLGILQFISINFLSILIVSLTFRDFLLVFGIILPLIIIVIINQTSLMVFDKKLQKEGSNENFEKDFFDKLNLLFDKIISLENKNYLTNFERNHLLVINKYEKMAGVIKDNLITIFSMLKDEFKAVQHSIKTIRVEQDDVRNLQEKISKYESGYAFTITKTYFKNLILLQNELSRKFNSPEDRDFIEKNFSNFFSNNNVIFTQIQQMNKFDPETMIVKSEISTNDPNLHHCIESVLFQGYGIDLGDKLVLIEKAKVKIYSFKKEEN